jgi:uncharacterized membrane protein YhiD involved in acid resistance
MDVGTIAPAAATVGHLLLILIAAASLGAALGIVRPVRAEIVPRSVHVIQAQILLAVVGAIIIVVVAESLARAFAIVGAAGLVRYRARISDPKDAGVMLVSLALGLTVGSGMFAFAFVACLFVIAILWLLESFEPAAQSRYELTISAPDAPQLRGEVEQAMQSKGLTFELLGTSQRELHYEITVPFEVKAPKLTKLVRGLAERHGAEIEWDIEKHKPRKP